MRGAELYSPCKEAYAMLKEAVVGGQSLVFKRYQEAGVTRIRPHQFKEPNVCKRIIGYERSLSVNNVEKNVLLEGRGHPLSKSGRCRA